MQIPRIAVYRGTGLQHSKALSRPVLILDIPIAERIDCVPGNYSLHVEYGNGKKRHFNFYVPLEDIPL